MPLRQFMARHPAVVEATRAAASLAAEASQVVVFERSWAYIVAASSGEVLQPRRLVDSESQLFVEDGLAPDDVSTNLAADIEALNTDRETRSFPITDERGDTVCALTVLGPVSAEVEPVLSSLARILTGLIVSSGPPAGGSVAAELDPGAIADGLRDAVLVVDESFEIIWTNEAVGSLLGRSRYDMIGRNAVDLIHPDDVAAAFDAMARIVAGLTIYRVIARMSHGDGGWARVEVTGTDQTANPSIGGIVLSLRSSELELELEQSERRTKDMSEALIEHLHDGIIAIDELGSITLVNRAAYDLFGIPTGTPPAQLSWRDFALLDEHGALVAREHHPVRVTFGARFEDCDEMSIVPRSGNHHYVSVAQRSVRATDGTLQGSFVTFRDVTESREAQAMLVAQARHDHLTGLPNRRMLNEYLDDLGTDLARKGSKVAACFIDLDVFKLINDTHGHRTGDEMIRMSAERLSEILRGDDLLVRLGGDEFVVIMASVTSEARTKETASRLLDSLAAPFIIDGLRFDITASAGVALASLDDLDPETLLRQADIALYAAKERGRNRVELFDGELEVTTEVAERQRRMLRHALDHDGIVMHFQPLIDARTGEPYGVEALARCLDSEGVLHGPSSFLESIDGSGLIWELDQRAFRLSCDAAAVLASVSNGKVPTVACNFSPLSIVQAEFVSFVTRTVREAGVLPENICIEITESAAFSGGEASLDAVTDLAGAGFSVALDDFGTGYSSLSHLRDLPLTSVKVDKSFVAKLAGRSPERAIAEAVVGLAGDLGLGIVAEGVETESQLAAAQDLGFHLMQGWHYAAAMPFDELLHTWASFGGVPTSPSQ